MIASQFELMTATPIHSLVIKLSVPAVISMLVTNIYNLADTAFVGRLGNSASGAVGIVFGFMSILQAVGFMFGQGSGSIVSRALGRKDVEKADRTASTGFFASLLLGALIAVISFITLDKLVLVLGSTRTIAPFAREYIGWILLAAPFMTSSFVLNNLLRYEGKAYLGMIGLLTGAFLNIAGDPLLIFGFHLGIGGAGISTAFSQTVSFIVLLSMFLSGRSECSISLSRVDFSGTMVADIVTTGFPSLLRQGLGSASTVLLNSLAGAYGDAAVAAMSIVSRIIFFVVSFPLGIGQGFQPVCAFNYGARKYGRVREAYRFACVAGEIVIAAGILFVMLFSTDLIGLFRDDPEVIKIGTRALRLQCVSLLFLPFGMITEMLYQSTGHRAGAALLSSMRGGVLFIPALLILSRLRGLRGIQEAQAVVFVLSFIPALIYSGMFFRKLPKGHSGGAMRDGV